MLLEINFPQYLRKKGGVKHKSPSHLKKPSLVQEGADKVDYLATDLKDSSKWETTRHIGLPSQ